jgi:PKD repeat protein
VVGENITLAFQYLSSGSQRRWSVDEIATSGTVAVPVMSVLSPIAGDVWQQGTSHDILWNSSNTLQYVDIELTLNASSGSQVWETIATNVVADDGSWTWNIAPDQTTSYDCQIRVSDHADSDVSALSGLFSIIEPVETPDILITEIMYNPPESGTDSIEFIEIYNNGDFTADLGGYSFNQGIEFTFPTMDIIPGEYVLIAKSAAAMQNTFGVTTLEWTDGSLSNSGEAIVLVNDIGFIVDSVLYNDEAPWPTAADGDGPSATFRDYTLDNNMGENWFASVHLAAINADNDTIWATPGYGAVLMPIADFIADNDTIDAGGEVNFTDLSLNDPTYWRWTFEGGDPATFEGQAPPAIMYAMGGVYDVTLMVSNEAGESTLTMEDYILVGTAPTPDFEANDTIIDVNDLVDFTDLSTGDVEIWEWSFEGGTPATSDEQNPIGIQYTSVGLFDVSLTVTNSYGYKMITKEEYIKVGNVGINDQLVNGELSIYPNPSSSFVNIECNNEKFQRILVYNAVGTLVKEIAVSGQVTRMESFDATGIYFVQLLANDGSRITKRLIIR